MRTHDALVRASCAADRLPRGCAAPLAALAALAVCLTPCAFPSLALAVLHSSAHSRLSRLVTVPFRARAADGRFLLGGRPFAAAAASEAASSIEGVVQRPGVGLVIVVLHAGEAECRGLSTREQRSIVRQLCSLHVTLCVIAIDT